MMYLEKQTNKNVKIKIALEHNIIFIKPQQESLQIINVYAAMHFEEDKKKREKNNCK